MNKFIVFLSFLNKGSTVTFLFFSSALLISLNLLFVLFFVFEGYLCFTNPDYRLIRMTHPSTYSGLTRVSVILQTIRV
jgi:hypothetical protein